MDSGLDASSVLFVIIHPGHFGGSQSTQLQQSLRREYLKQSYVPSSFTEVARDPVFQQYLMNV